MSGQLCNIVERVCIRNGSFEGSSSKIVISDLVVTHECNAVLYDCSLIHDRVVPRESKET